MANMRRLTYFVAATLDGYIAGPEGGDPTNFWPIGDDYVDYIKDYYPETLPDVARAALGVTADGTQFDTAIEGRRSYEIGLSTGTVDAFPHLEHIVFSTTLSSMPESDVVFVSSSALSKIRALKRETGKGIWLVGGGLLANSLRSEIDELIIKLSPISIGNGIPIWGANPSFDLSKWERVSCEPLPGGTTILKFARI